MAYDRSVQELMGCWSAIALIKFQFGQGQTWGQWKSYQKSAGCKVVNQKIDFYSRRRNLFNVNIGVMLFLPPPQPPKILWNFYEIFYEALLLLNEIIQFIKICSNITRANKNWVLGGELRAVVRDDLCFWEILANQQNTSTLKVGYDCVP